MQELIYNKIWVLRKRGEAPTLRYWDDVVRGGDGRGGRGEWAFGLVERSEQNQGKGVDMRRAESCTASWIDLEQ